MTPAGTPDPEYPEYSSENGIRNDGQNLIDMWLSKQQVGDKGDSLLPTNPCAWGQASLIPWVSTHRVPAMSGTGQRCWLPLQTPA